jgi:hypothetical protein
MESNEIKRLKFITINAQRLPRNSHEVQYSFNDKILDVVNLSKEYFKLKGFNIFFTGDKFWKLFLVKLFYHELKLDKEDIYFKKLYTYDKQFYKRNKEELDNRLEYLSSSDLYSQIEQSPVYSVESRYNDKIKTFLEIVGKTPALKVIEFLLKDFIHHYYGFPKLFAYNENEVFFCEAKTENNPITRNQIKKHKFLMNCSFNITIVRINKDASKFKRLYEDSYFKPKTFHEKYLNMIEISENVSEELSELDMTKIKNEVSTEYFIAFLNALNDLEYFNKLKILKNYKMVEDSTLKELDRFVMYRTMCKYKRFEDRKDFEGAIKGYFTLKDNMFNYVAFKRICMCYRKLKQFDNEINLIEKCIINETLPKKEKIYFEKRIKRLLRKCEFDSETDMCCPNCGNTLIIKSRQDNGELTKFLVCSNEKCLWFGGIYN